MPEEIKKLCIVMQGSSRLPIEILIECIENYKKIFAWANPDIWAFTWKTEDGREEQLRPHVYKLFAEENSPTDEFLDSIGFPYTQQLKQRYPANKVCRIGHYSTIYGLDFLFKKIIESGEKYEYALRARNDLYFEGNTNDWEEIVRNDPNAYITHGVLWGDHNSQYNDHIGFSRFDLVKNIWAYDKEIIDNVFANSWAPEYYIKIMSERNNTHQHVAPVEKYILKRVGRNDASEKDEIPVFNQDWIIK